MNDNFKTTMGRAFTWMIYKLTSGRFILSIMAGVGLLMMEMAIIDVLKIKTMEEGSTVTATELLAFASTIFVVIQSVFMSYFSMRRENQDKEHENENLVHPDDIIRPKQFPDTE